MAAHLEHLLAPPPRADTSSMQGGISVEPPEKRQGGSLSQVESSSRRPCRSTPLAPTQGQSELPPCSPQISMSGPRT
jgi:hypothetical protein